MKFRIRWEMRDGREYAVATYRGRKVAEMGYQLNWSVREVEEAAVREAARQWGFACDSSPIKRVCEGVYDIAVEGAMR